MIRYGAITFGSMCPDDAPMPESGGARASTYGISRIASALDA